MQSVTIPAVHPGFLFGRFFGTSDPTLKHQMFPPTEYFGSFGAVFRGCSPDLRQLPCESVLIPGSEKFCGFSHSVDYIPSETDSLRRSYIHRFLPLLLHPMLLTIQVVIVRAISGIGNRILCIVSLDTAEFLCFHSIKKVPIVDIRFA